MEMLDNLLIFLALRCFVWISSQCPHKNQCGLELKIILSIGNDEEPFFFVDI
jgi:hypothetical protein